MHPAIKLREENANDTKSFLASVNRKATRYTITEYFQVLAFAKMCEARLKQMGVPRYRRSGVHARYRPAGLATPSRHSVLTTEIALTRTPQDWLLTGATRVKVRAGDPELFQLNLNNKAAVSAIHHAIGGVLVEGEALTPSVIADALEVILLPPIENSDEMTRRMLMIGRIWKLETSGNLASR